MAVTDEQAGYLRCERLALRGEILRMQALIEEAEQRLIEIDVVLQRPADITPCTALVLAALPPAGSMAGMTARELEAASGRLNRHTAHSAFARLQRHDLARPCGDWDRNRGQRWQRSPKGDQLVGVFA